MPTFIPIQNQSFIKVVSSGAIFPEVNSPISLTCKDNQGNTIKKTIVEIDSSLSNMVIMLPIIESLANDLDCEIDFIILDNTNLVEIIVGYIPLSPLPAIDLIGQQQVLNLNAGQFTAGAVITFKPAYEGYWSYSVTEN